MFHYEPLDEGQSSTGTPSPSEHEPLTPPIFGRESTTPPPERHPGALPAPQPITLGGVAHGAGHVAAREVAPPPTAPGGGNNEPPKEPPGSSGAEYGGEDPEPDVTVLIAEMQVRGASFDHFAAFDNTRQPDERETQLVTDITRNMTADVFECLEDFADTDTAGSIRRQSIELEYTIGQQQTHLTLTDTGDLTVRLRNADTTLGPEEAAQANTAFHYYQASEETLLGESNEAPIEAPAPRGILRDTTYPPGYMPPGENDWTHAGQIEKPVGKDEASYLSVLVHKGSPPKVSMNRLFTEAREEQHNPITEHAAQQGADVLSMVATTYLYQKGSFPPTAKGSMTKQYITDDNRTVTIKVEEAGSGLTHIPKVVVSETRDATPQEIRTMLEDEASGIADARLPYVRITDTIHYFHRPTMEDPNGRVLFTDMRRTAILPNGRDISDVMPYFGRASQLQARLLRNLVLGSAPGLELPTEE